jgi:hypothetical protein
MRRVGYPLATEILVMLTLYPIPLRVFAARLRVTLLKNGMLSGRWLVLMIAYVTVFVRGSSGTAASARWWVCGRFRLTALRNPGSCAKSRPLVTPWAKRWLRVLLPA